MRATRKYLLAYQHQTAEEEGVDIVCQYSVDDTNAVQVGQFCLGLARCLDVCLEEST